MEKAIVGLCAERLTGYDFLIAGVVVLFVEYIIKKLICKDKAPTIVMKLAPIVLGAVFYVVLSFVQGSVWYMGLVHGLMVGLTAMGSYDVILKTIKESGIKAIDEINEDVKEAIETDK